MRHSQPCTRGGLKSTRPFVFMEEIAAVEVKLTDASLYNVLYKELLKHSHRREPKTGTAHPNSHGPGARRHDCG